MRKETCPSCSEEFNPEHPKCFSKKFFLEGTTKTYCPKCSPVIKLADKSIHTRSGTEHAN